MLGTVLFSSGVSFGDLVEGHGPICNGFRSYSYGPLLAQVDSNQGLRKCGRMYLVDLAGSETVSKTNASGQTLQVRPS